MEVVFSPQSVTLVETMGSDLTVVNAARVSFDKESDWVLNEECCGNPINCKGGSSDCCGNPRGVYELSSRDTGLINYLAKHKHLSPFNHAFATFRVKAPIFVARQLVKHEYMPWNEVSRRYVDSDPEFYKPESFRLRADNVKQGSSSEVFDGYFWTEDDVGVDTPIMEVFDWYTDHALRIYKGMLDKGICPEQARMVLPQHTMTEWYWSGSLGAFAKMLKLRMAEDTQYETREIANKIYDELVEIFPVSLKALIDND